jgi:mRNA interferase RelE/StbE
MNISLQDKALKFVKALAPKQAKQIFVKLFELTENPKPHDSQKLKGFKEDIYRVTSGEFRIAYKISENTINVIIIGKRNDDEIYEKLSRVEK